MRPTHAEFVIAREQSKEDSPAGEDAKHVCHWYRGEFFYLPPANRALERIRQLAASIAAAGVVGATAAQAQTVGGGTDPSTILQAITTYILGPFGQSLAVLGLIAVGISFLLGRLGLFVLAAFIGGLILIFGSSYLVSQFLGGV
jgi:type IV secretion system protein VirB2